MKVTLLVIGKTDKGYLKEGIDIFEKRLKRYIPYEMKVIPDIKNTKNLSEKEQKEQEGKKILEAIGNSDEMILLDDKGKQYTSIAYSEFMQSKMNLGIRNLFFVIGGPYGCLLYTSPSPRDA